MTAFYYFYQNASVFCFLVQIRAAVLILAEISNLNMHESNNKMYFDCAI